MAAAAAATAAAKSRRFSAALDLAFLDRLDPEDEDARDPVPDERPLPFAAWDPGLGLRPVLAAPPILAEAPTGDLFLAVRPLEGEESFRVRRSKAEPVPVDRAVGACLRRVRRAPGDGVRLARPTWGDGVRVRVPPIGTGLDRGLFRRLGDLRRSAPLA
jgi:hypothetical protein